MAAGAVGVRVSRSAGSDDIDRIAPCRASRGPAGAILTNRPCRNTGVSDPSGLVGLPLVDLQDEVEEADLALVLVVVFHVQQERGVEDAVAGVLLLVGR